MPTTCAVYHCPSPRGLTYHVFPSDPEQALRWAGNWTKRKVLNLRNARICSNHFKETDYKRDLRNELLGLPLRKIFVDPKNVVPSMNLSPVDPDSGDSDEGSEAMNEKYSKPLKKGLKKRKAKTDADSRKVKYVRYDEDDSPAVEIIEYQPDIKDIKSSMEHIDEVEEAKDPSQDEHDRLSDSNISTDCSDDDSSSESEFAHESYEDPYAVIQRLKERLVLKNKRIQYLKKKLKYSKASNDVQFVYVQDVSQMNENKEKSVFRIMCDKR